MTMNSKLIRFSQALPLALEAIKKSGLQLGDFLVVRDIYGRIRLAFNGPSVPAHASLNSALDALGAFAAGEGKHILYAAEFFDPKEVFQSKDIVQIELPESDCRIRLLDRQIVGQEWLLPQQLSDTIRRLVFYGFKGGVERTTALTLAAYHLANQGKRVLLIDLDLESPGLSSLVLPPDQRADFGLVDWFVEDAVGQGESVVEKMVSASPLGQVTQGAIRVASAMGSNTVQKDYLCKLARVYADINRSGTVERFAARVGRLVAALEKQEKPDVVLIDSCAGLHDLAAISIVGLANVAYMFGTGSVQHWAGLRLLFSHWQAYPEIVKQIRERLVMIHAMFPKTDQESRADQFLQQSYSLFSETLYELIEPGSVDTLDAHDTFNYDLNDESAPHYPTQIGWDERLVEFNPLHMSKSQLEDRYLGAAFDRFFARIVQDATIA